MSDSPDRSPATRRLARAGAIACSLGLGAFVIVHAQLGCDAPASEVPGSADAAAQPVAPAVAPPEAEPASPPTPEPSAQATEPEPEPEPVVNAPVYMPASKSGGDFGAMPFPGEAAAQAPTQQAVPEPR